MRAAAVLAAARDLLAAQVGPGGVPRGPDAALLGDRRALTGATGRLADVVLAATVHAAALAQSADQRAAVALRAAGALAAPVAQIRDQTRADRASAAAAALADVPLLLGDPTAHPLDRQLHALRLAVHDLTRPGVDPSHHVLVAVADTAAVIAAAAADVTRQAATHHRPQADWHQAAELTSHAGQAWRVVAQALQRVDSLGVQGGATRRLAVDTARRAALPAAVVAARRALVELPDLAAASQTIHRQLRPRLYSRHGEDLTVVAPYRHDALHSAYRRAHALSTRTLDAVIALPGEQPLRGRATHQTQTARLAAAAFRPWTPTATTHTTPPPAAPPPPGPGRRRSR